MFGQINLPAEPMIMVQSVFCKLPSSSLPGQLSRDSGTARDLNCGGSALVPFSRHSDGTIACGARAVASTKARKLRSCWIQEIRACNQCISILELLALQWSVMVFVSRTQRQKRNTAILNRTNLKSMRRDCLRPPRLCKSLRVRGHTGCRTGSRAPRPRNGTKPFQPRQPKGRFSREPCASQLGVGINGVLYNARTI